MAFTGGRKYSLEIEFLGTQLKREDLSLIALFLGVAAIIAVTAIFMPDAFRDAKPIVASVPSTGGSVAVDSLLDRGIYALGKVQMTVGSSADYIDSTIDLEYDRTVLNSVAQNGDNDTSAANQFFREARSKIKDAIITQASGLSGQRLSGDGLDELKIHLLGAINDAFATDRDLVTNIYFQEFLQLPPEN